MKIKCLYNDPENLPNGISSDFDYGLILGKEYIVTGIMKSGDQFLYFIDENRKPGFFPKELFEVTDSQLSSKWHFRFYSKEDVMYKHVQVICGYFELCFDQDHYEQLVVRENEAVDLYFKRKMEMSVLGNNL